MGRSFVSPKEAQETKDEEDSKSKRQQRKATSNATQHTLNLMLMLKLKFVAVKQMHFDGISRPKHDKKKVVEDSMHLQRIVNS